MIFCSEKGDRRMNKNAEEEYSRFVVWKGATFEDCGPEDRHSLAELLKPLHLSSLQDLNGLKPSVIREQADRLEQILGNSDLGRLVNVCRPGASPSRSTNLSAQPVGLLDLSVRSTNCLDHAEIKTIGELNQWSLEQLLRIKNMGRKSAMEIREKLQELVLQNPDESQFPPSHRPECLPLAALLTLEQCGLNSDVSQRLSQAGICRLDDLVARNIESLRYWAGLVDSEISDLRQQLGRVDLRLESLLPLWVRGHYDELQKAFEEEVGQLLSHGTVISPPLLGPVHPTTTCLEDELETFFRAKTDCREKEIVRRLMGWDGGQGTTLENAGLHFDLTRERIRQIRENTLQPLTALKPMLLEKAVECVERCVPAYAEDAESALAKAGILRTSFRVESIEKTARYFEVAVPWTSETWNSRRFVVNPAAMHGIRDFFTAARKRVSHYGITRKDYVLAEISTEVKVETLNLYCSILEGLVWLDDVRDWFWLPTGKNSVLNRLAKILRVAPRLAIAEARAGILRDRRMGEVELPPDIFRNLCISLPWCRVEEDELAAAEGVPADEEDSNEMLLVEILRRLGPVMRRRDLWTTANGSGIEKVHFDRLLSDSNVIVRPAPEVYGLIGSEIVTPRDLVREAPEDDALEFSERPEMDLPAGRAPGSSVLDQCDPESADFHEQVLSSIYARSDRLRDSGTWSLMELKLTDNDFRKLCH